MKFRGETQKRTEKSIALQLDFLDSMIWWCGGQWVYCPFSLNMKRVSPLVTVADNDVMHFQQGGKSILRRLTFATLFMRRQEQNAKKNLTKKKLRCYTSEVFFLRIIRNQLLQDAWKIARRIRKAVVW